jgi:hypothetical protein
VSEEKTSPGEELAGIALEDSAERPVTGHDQAHVMPAVDRQSNRWQQQVDAVPLLDPALS